MILLDVNVLVYAYRRDSNEHEQIARWLERVTRSPVAFGLAELVLSGVVRILTHPRIFPAPTAPPDALAFVTALHEQPSRVRVEPGPRHWSIFTDLCRRTSARGNAVPDAYLAALAIESGSEWVTTDRGFARFPGLRWRHPLEE